MAMKYILYKQLNHTIMSEDNQQEQQNSGSEQIPERIEPVFQTEDIIIRSLDDDINQK